MKIKYYYKTLYYKEDDSDTLCNKEDKYWYRNGNLHREGGPAIEYADGYKVWFIDDKLHREVCFKYSKWYHKNGLHRLDGPAFEYRTDYKAWYYYGQLIFQNTGFSNED